MGSPSIVFSIHVRPHIRKYLMVCWAPGEHLTDPNAQRGLHEFSQVLRRPILHAVLDEQLVSVPRSDLRLQLLGRSELYLSGRMAKAFNFRAEQLYNTHFHGWSTHMMAYSPRTINQVIMDWRQRYGLLEEDLPMRTSVQSFLRYRSLHSLVLPRGGARYCKRQPHAAAQ